jgi:tRNA G10  N-methylase Trm11
MEILSINLFVAVLQRTLQYTAGIIMIKELWKQIEENQEVRQNLSKLRQELKQDSSKTAFLYHLADREEILVNLLKSEDAKTRKNTASIMGDLGEQRFLAPLYQAYLDEKTLFVKSTYLNAMKEMDYRDYLEAFKLQLEILMKQPLTIENKKHLSEEIRELSSLIIMMEGIQAHEFHPSQGSYRVILLTNRNFQENTLMDLKKRDSNAVGKIFNAGVMADVSNLDWLDSIRTYQEVLFIIKGMKTCEMTADHAAKTIVESQLFQFLSENHKGAAPFYFRVELKSKMELDKRSAFTKKLSSEIERLSQRKLINTTSNYEFEIRLVENKEGSCNIMVKLYTLKDERFSYRKSVMPTSIRPINAALTVELAKDYLKEDGQVLDPFCGVGTMLIERHKVVAANTTYGIDIQEEAIQKARENTEAAHQIIHYINRDFFDFKHEYLFDEIITDMPFRIGRKTEDEIYDLYSRFFESAKDYLIPHGIIIMYSRDRDYVYEMAPKTGYAILETKEVSMKEGTYVIVLRVK